MVGVALSNRAGLTFKSTKQVSAAPSQNLHAVVNVHPFFVLLSVLLCFVCFVLYARVCLCVHVVGFIRGTLFAGQHGNRVGASIPAGVRRS